MLFALSKENVLEHLRGRLIDFEASSIAIEPKLAKNFNLLVTSDQQHFLVKQEPIQHRGDRKGDLYHEWKLHEVIQKSELKILQPFISQLIDYDLDREIAIFRYLQNYDDLSEFYESTSHFPTQIAIALGRTLAIIHHSTIDQTELQTTSESFEDDLEKFDRSKTAEYIEDFGLLTPAGLSTTSTAGLKFYQLYQRYESLGQAIAHLNETIQPCCLTHQDLKLNNILLHQDWAKQSQGLQNAASEDTAMIRLIDWEKWEWGEPASDLGALVASYLRLWLRSLLISRGMDIELSLRLAEHPLEQLQPSLVGLVTAYLQQFPEIIDRFPNFLARVMQFAGLSLIESIRASLHYYEPFGNCEICMLQVAKSLLCSPIAACESIFGKPIDAIADTSLEFSPEPLETEPIQDRTEFPIACYQTDPGRQLSYALNVSDNVMPIWLIDIAEKIQMDSPTRIEHWDYEPLHLPESINLHYQHLSSALQHQHLNCQLCNYLYRIYWSGEQALRSKPSNSALAQPLQNDQYRGLNAAFYDRLHQANQGSGYEDPDWQVQARTQAGWIVQKQGLKLWIDADQVIARLSNRPEVGDRITIQLPKNRIEERYYVAIGNAGGIDVHSTFGNDAKILQICFNLTETAIVSAMQQITQALNPLQIPFTFAVRFDPVDYACRDTGILEIARSHYEYVQPILRQLYQTERSAFRPDIPQFMKPLAPGIGLAEKPPSESLGIHRCQIIAEALIQCWQRHLTTPEAKIKAIQQVFEQRGLDWQYPYLDAGSTDVYTFQVMFEQS